MILEDRLLEAREVAELLSVPESWVRAQAREGAIPHLKIGRYVRFEAAAIAEWLETCRQPGRPTTFRRYSPTNGGDSRS